MSRYKFDTAEAYIVVDPSGFFDVFAEADRPTHQRPAYRGELTELGREVAESGRLSVRPDSTAMFEAVEAWSAANGAAAIAGSLGLGRQGTAPLAVAEQKVADQKSTDKKTARDEVAEAKKGKKS